MEQYDSTTRDTTQRFVDWYKARGNRFTFELDSEAVQELNACLVVVEEGQRRYAEQTANLRFVG